MTIMSGLTAWISVLLE